MSVNILVDPMPEVVEISGVRYPIETNFRTYILMESLFNDDDISEDEKALMAIELAFPDPMVRPSSPLSALQAIAEFIRCGKPKIPGIENLSHDDDINGRIYDYEQDDLYIYAAFLSQYNIDLNEIEYMHWWKFKALFLSLSEHHKISEIMNIRSVRLSDVKDKEQRKKYGNLKVVYKIRKKRSDADRDEKLNEIVRIAEGFADE